jgi:SAM-dependent methyltransferase
MRETNPERIMAKTALGTEISKAQSLAWGEYLKIFKDRWNLAPGVAEYAAICGGDLFEAEFAEHGVDAYAASVILPIRNAFYQMFMLPFRWEKLREMGVADPVLDYGCGVGLLANWLHDKGHRDVYGYEPPGIQQEIMARSFEGKPDIHVWDGKTPDRFNTVICLNVLEHVEDPVGLLKKLYRLSNRVIADVCIDEETKLQTPHIAPHEALRECADILRDHGSLYSSEPHAYKTPKERDCGI